MTNKEMRELCDQATPEPWERCHHLQSKEKDKSCPCGFPGDIWGADQEHVVCTMGPLIPKGEEGMHPPGYPRDKELANAHFITASRTKVPQLLDQVDKLEKDNISSLQMVNTVNDRYTESLEIIKKQEAQLERCKTAIEFHVKGMPQKFGEIEAIYKEVFGTEEKG